MDTYNINNKKYNIDFAIKFDSFYNFLESLKDSKKYYHDYCNKENINTQDFDTEYINTINILKSELLKSYILITNDKDAEKYVIINETIRDLYNFMIKEFKKNTFEGRILYGGDSYETCQRLIIKNLNVIRRQQQLEDIPDAKGMYLLESDKLFMWNIDINHLTGDYLSRLIDIYASNNDRYDHFKVGFLRKMKIDVTKIEYTYNIDLRITDNYVYSKRRYLNTLTYKTVYERELDKILTNLPNICVSNIQSKSLNNANNQYLVNYSGNKLISYTYLLEILELYVFNQFRIFFKIF